jgi:hypothetical protein
MYMWRPMYMLQGRPQVPFKEHQQTLFRSCLVEALSRLQRFLSESLEPLRSLTRPLKAFHQQCSLKIFGAVYNLTKSCRNT